MIKRLIYIFCCFAFATAAFTQNKVTFQATANAKQVVQGNAFEVSFKLTNAQGRNFRAPSFKGFQVLSGPSSSMSTQIINGKMTQEMGYSYTLLAEKVGRFTIPEASIQAGNKILQTAPITIQVVKGNAKANGNGDEAFVQAEVSTTDAYIGQQITVDFKLYTTVNIDNFSTLSEPTYDGFFAQDIRRYNAGVFQEVIEGKQYTTKVLKKVSLFPQQAGVLTIEPLKMQLGVVVPGQRSSGFFFRKQTKPLYVSTQPVEINVRSLPANAPTSFSGSIGTFSLQANVTPTNITTDDAIAIRMRVIGTGDVKRLQPPTLTLPDGFEVYDPSILEENSVENQGQINSSKTFEYLALAANPGQYLISPEFSYFDPDSSKYITLRANSTRINVRRGTGTASVSKSNAQKQQNTDIRYIKAATNWDSNSNSFFGTGLFWVLCLLPLVGVLGAFVTQRIRSGANDIDASAMQMKQAAKVAQKKLSFAKTHLDSVNSKAFYDEISKALLGYVGDKLQIPTADMSKNNVREKLNALKVSAENIDGFMQLLQRCEMALFAGMDNSAAMNETYQKTADLIAAIESEI